jgi:hypothetical protein
VWAEGLDSIIFGSLDTDSGTESRIKKQAGERGWGLFQEHIAPFIYIGTGYHVAAPQFISGRLVIGQGPGLGSDSIRRTETVYVTETLWAVPHISRNED